MRWRSHSSNEIRVPIRTPPLPSNRPPSLQSWPTATCYGHFPGLGSCWGMVSWWPKGKEGLGARVRFAMWIFTSFALHGPERVRGRTSYIH